VLAAPLKQKKQGMARLPCRHFREHVLAAPLKLRKATRRSARGALLELGDAVCEQSRSR
jgi:hypothetical protein